MKRSTFDRWAKNIGYATIATGAAILVDKVVESMKEAGNKVAESSEDTAEEEITAL